MTVPENSSIQRAPLKMKDTPRLAILFLLSSICVALAQEAPSPSGSPGLAPTAPPSGMPTPSPTMTSVRSVRLSFVPPPMEGTISLGIFDANKKLVRILCREAKIDQFAIEETSLTTTWDGKDDAGEDLPPGKYHARGYMVGELKIEEISPAEGTVLGNPPAGVPVKLMVNPLISDTRSVMEMAIGSDNQSAYLKTTDGLPLRTIARSENIGSDLFLVQRPDKSLAAFLGHDPVTREFRVTGASKMMAFDCGDFELK